MTLNVYAITVTGQFEINLNGGQTQVLLLMPSWPLSCLVGVKRHGTSRQLNFSSRPPLHHLVLFLPRARSCSWAAQVVAPPRAAPPTHALLQLPPPFRKAAACNVATATAPVRTGGQLHSSWYCSSSAVPGGGGGVHRCERLLWIDEGGGRCGSCEYGGCECGS